MSTVPTVDGAFMACVRSTMLLVAWLAAAPGAVAQQRSMVQDPALNNFRHALGTRTAAFGELGRVRKVGSGARVLLLIPGLGFGDDIWTEFMERHASDYTMYAITLPGFGGTDPLPTPPENAAITDVPWTRSALAGIVTLLDNEQVDRVTVIAHWIHATQLAVLLASEHGERVDSVVLVGGVLKNYMPRIQESLHWTSEQRARNAEAWKSRWFRTVTRETWDDNNFMSYDYAVNPRRGLYLWRQAQSPSVTVWIHYLLEFWSLDVAPLLETLRVPVLLIQPQFDDPDFYVEPDADYMRAYCIGSWEGSAAPIYEVVKVPHSRLFVMYDRPEILDRAIAEVLARPSK